MNQQPTNQQQTNQQPTNEQQTNQQPINQQQTNQQPINQQQTNQQPINQQQTNQQPINNYNEILIFQNEKLSWEQAIDTYNGNVPLDIWYNYICWYEQKITVDPENKYQAVLGKCLSIFEYNESYKQDLRMVKLWMKYINLSQNPLNIYQVLYERGVGTQWAIFYIGWAQYYDVANAFKQAESVYNLGFQAKAKPTTELEEAHAKFRHSVAQRLNKDNNSIKKRTVDHLVDQQQAIETVNSNPVPVVKRAKQHETTTSSNYNDNTTTSVNVISSSLNSVYGDAYDCDDQGGYDSLGINIPPNFVRVARNNHETWTGALCLEEPYEPNKLCKYQKHLVYTGNGTEYSPEEIRARKFSQLIAMCRERNRRWELEKAMKREEKARIEAERLRIEQENLRQIELERLRQQAEQERLRIAVEQERARAAEYERVRLAEIERQTAAERQRQQAEDFRQKQILEQELAKKAENERMRYTNETSYSANGYNIQNTVSSNAASDDIEEQIEASTIRFSTGNGLSSKPKTITIKYRKEKPSTGGDFDLPKVPSPSVTQMSHSKPKKERKRKSKKTSDAIGSTLSSNGQNYGQISNHTDNKYHEMMAPRTNNIDDANLLLNIANVDSYSNDDSSYSYSSNYAIPVQSSYLTNDDSYSNSDYPLSSSYSIENSNGTYPFNNSSTPVRNIGRSSHQNESNSKSSTPHNFRILKRRTSNISYQNDDSMSSISGEQNSFFATENSEELKQKRLEKALSTIETHLAKSNLDPFNSELCKALLVKADFPSRDHDDLYKLIGTPMPKLLNTKVALLGNIPFQIEKEVGRGSYGSVFKAINCNTGAVVALKYQKPPNNWELYICREVRRKITNYDMLLGFMDISTAIIAPNASIFVTEFSQYGSLLDINNRIRQGTTKVMHESLVMHFASQILTIVDHLHSCKIIHADIKPDNFLLMKIPDPTSHLPTIKTQFKKRIETDGFTCTEMLDGRPWSYQTDIFCIAGTIHVMLFGEYMQTVKKFGQWDIKSKLPRYLKKHIWSDLFSNFLNIKDMDHLPSLIEFKSRIDSELYNMDSELQSQIRSLSNILHRR